VRARIEIRTVAVGPIPVAVTRVVALDPTNDVGLFTRLALTSRTNRRRRPLREVLATCPANGCTVG
jgi:hypothetical protein